jgi:hypothetical protein
MSSTEVSNNPGFCPVKGQILSSVLRNSKVHADNNISGDLAQFHLAE